MGVDVRVGGAPEWNASRVAVDEDSTPIDPSDTSSGRVGAVSFSLPPGVAYKSLLNATVEVDDSDRGTVQGVVAAVSGDRAGVRVQAHGRLVALVAYRTALPHIGTVETAVTYYLGLCGITTGIVVDPAVADTPVIAPGWYDNVWEIVNKQFGPAYQVEIAPVGDEVHVRPTRGFTMPRLRGDESDFAWSLDQSQLAQTVEAWFYPVTEITDELVVGNELSVVSNLGAGEAHEFDIDLGASLSSVVQPVCVAAVDFDAADASEYSVLDQFDEPVDPDYWRTNGGRVTVEISEDTRSLHVTVVGCQERSRAPYRLVAARADGTEFSTLRVIGTGVTVGRGKYTMPAAIGAAAEVGAEVDNLFIGSWGHAHLVLLSTAGRYGSPSQRISGTAAFAGQAFGNVAGARVFDDFNVYRIRSATVTPSAVGYAAESDVTFDDVTAVNDGFTIAEWNALWEGRPISEYNLRPLTPIGVASPPAGGLYPGSLTFPSSTTFPGA